ncbi:MAG: hypothetical protein FJ314_10105 [SAR202 cluster bacterium]|nr:hypothetical protein [SAR202 cluster bacterium]
MSAFLERLRAGPLLADGAMGSLLFERTGRLSEPNHVYEALNLDRPELIRGVHTAYLQAGAHCISTNTFGANLTYLEPMGEGARVTELNEAGVRLAREAIAAFQDQTGVQGPFFVLGSVGPTRTADEPPDVLRQVYEKQLKALMGAGIDAVLFETFDVFDHLVQLIRQAKSIDRAMPVIAEIAARMQADGITWQEDPVGFARAVIDAGADVIGVNCCAPWEAATFVEAVSALSEVRDGKVLISVMPNAGGPQRIGHRYMTHVNPEYMGKQARAFAGKGVHLIGGCCEVHPNHIAEMHNYLQGLQAGSTVAPALSGHAMAPAGDSVKKDNGRFSRKIKSGEFAVSVELLPPRGTANQNLKSKIEFVREIADSGLADAIDLTDGSRGIPLLPPGDFVGVARETLGWDRATGDRVEFIPHFSTRDLNVLGLQSRLIGYHARRIHNVLFITGDPPKMAPTYPRSTAVFDLDSVSMVRYTHSYLNAGVDFGGELLSRAADPRTRFTIGAGCEPEAVNRDRELERLRRKIDAGVDYLFTQPAFRRPALELLEPFRKKVPILVGVMILSGLDHARRMAQVPGVVVPEELLQRMQAFEKIEDQAMLGQELAIEQVQWIRSQGWPGVYLMSPATHRPVIPVLSAALPAASADQKRGAR